MCKTKYNKVVSGTGSASLQKHQNQDSGGSLNRGDGHMKRQQEIFKPMSLNAFVHQQPNKFSSRKTLN